MAAFTPTQGRYLAYIHAYINLNSQSPSEAEIARALGVSAPSAHLMLKTLASKGLIIREPGKSRSIEISIDPQFIPKWKKSAKKILTARELKYAQLTAHLKTLFGLSDDTRLQTPEEPLVRRPTRRKSAPKTAEASNVQIYRLKITLSGLTPPIWRRVETKDINLNQLHDLIQDAMGWEGGHLHEFIINKIRYIAPQFETGDFDDGPSGSQDEVTKLSDLIRQHGSKPKIEYVYDFGDQWSHSVVVEKILDVEPGVTYPRCTDGARACPLEDIGGIYGYAEYLDALADPKNEDSQEMLEMWGKSDPEKFSAITATRRIKRGTKHW